MDKIQNILKSLKLEVEKKDLPDFQQEKILKKISEIDTILTQKSSKISKSVPSKSEAKADYQVWSDGACSGNPGPGGWGTIVQSGNTREEFSGFQSKTTNNQMEMTGSIEGLKQIPDGANVIVTTDSQYIVKGATQWIFGWKRKGWKKADGSKVLNLELWQEIDRQIQSKKIRWEWVKGHAGHEENERCDFLATEEIKLNV